MLNVRQHPTSLHVIHPCACSPNNLLICHGGYADHRHAEKWVLLRIMGSSSAGVKFAMSRFAALAMSTAGLDAGGSSTGAFDVLVTSVLLLADKSPKYLAPKS